MNLPGVAILPKTATQRVILFCCSIERSASCLVELSFMTKLKGSVKGLTVSSNSVRIPFFRHQWRRSTDERMKEARTSSDNFGRNLSEFDNEDVTNLFDFLLVTQSSENSFKERFNRNLLEASLKD